VARALLLGLIDRFHVLDGGQRWSCASSLTGPDVASVVHRPPGRPAYPKVGHTRAIISDDLERERAAAVAGTIRTDGATVAAKLLL
jgi:hypothetical protein